MNTSFPHHRPQDSAAYALHRDAAIISQMNTHPVTAAMLVRLGWFASTKKAQERLGILVRRKHVAKIGVVWRKPGRPENVYCGWRPKGDQLLHEVELTELCLQLSAARVLRGPAITDHAIRADAEVWINQDLYYLELDRGTMGMWQIERRLAKYERRPHLSLWVCRDEKRLAQVRARAEKVRYTALYTTLAEAMSGPHGNIWQDFAGGRASLPRERQAVPVDQVGSHSEQVWVVPDSGQDAGVPADHDQPIHPPADVVQAESQDGVGRADQGSVQPEQEPETLPT